MAGHVRTAAVLLALAALCTPALTGCGPGPAPPPPASQSATSAAPTDSPSPALEDPRALPALETEVFSGAGDISDDSAIWADPADPANSVVIADNKSTSGGGIGVFDMNGKLIHFRPDGMIGNVDLRAGFPSSGSSMVLVGGNNRSNNTLALLVPGHRSQDPDAGRGPEHRDRGTQLRFLHVPQQGQRKVLCLCDSQRTRVGPAVRA